LDQNHHFEILLFVIQKFLPKIYKKAKGFSQGLPSQEYFSFI